MRTYAQFVRYLTFTVPLFKNHGHQQSTLAMTSSHRKPSLLICSLYACILSSFFVLNLYLFVPSHVQKLDRSDVRQIKWRTFSVLITTVVASLTYPLLFYDEWSFDNRLILGDETMLLYLVRNMWGFKTINQTITFLPCLHAAILYSGSFVTAILEDYILYLRLKERHDLSQNNDKGLFVRTIIKRRKQIIKRTFPNVWQSSRDFIVAPFAEELIFRVCMIPPFLHNGQLSITQICWIVPIFFGFAHVHHAIRKLREGMPIQGVILATMAQFTYTTLFGAYVSYIYIKSGSLLAIALVHSFCNFMGLPNVYPFLIWNNVGSKKIQNTITMCKVLSAGVYLVGIYSFFILFDESTGLFKDGKQWW